ncbi:2'-5'-oligoadenylate synthase 1, partial [Ophiophagus hannah]
MPNPQIYVDLINYGQQGKFSSWFIELLKNFIINRPIKSGAFSPCFTELQKDFIKDQPTKLKSLIRLGGSLGKGTSMKNGSDADLVLFLNIFKSYTEQEKNRKMVIEEIERRLNECQELLNLEVFFEKSKWTNPRVLQFKLHSKESEDSIEFDVLPAYDALSQYDGSMPNPQIYVDLIRTGKSGEFSPCFTELQKDFIKGRPTKLKSLIRLVKHWYNKVQEKSFPPKYALELLTVYAWEKGSGKDGFNTEEGFRTVMWLIEHYKEIRIYWTKYYDFQNEIIKQYLQVQLGKNRRGKFQESLNSSAPACNI